MGDNKYFYQILNKFPQTREWIPAGEQGKGPPEGVKSRNYRKTQRFPRRGNKIPQNPKEILPKKGTPRRVRRYPQEPRGRSLGKGTRPQGRKAEIPGKRRDPPGENENFPQNSEEILPKKGRPAGVRRGPKGPRGRSAVKGAPTPPAPGSIGKKPIFQEYVEVSREVKRQIPTKF